jgi:rubrerythrin
MSVVEGQHREEYMGKGKAECEHSCRNTCAKLNEALQDELKKIEFYEAALVECDEPEIKKFIKEIAEEHRRLATRLSDRLSEIKAKSQVLDGVIASFEL